jgi:hypothetical protein
MTRVRFRADLVLDGEVAEVAGEDLLADPAPYAGPLAEELVGAIVIEAGQVRLEVADDLTAAALTLCFRGPAALLEQPLDQVVYRATLATAHTVLVPLADQVRVFGEGTPVITADKDELLPALYRCGLAITELLERVGDPAEAALGAADLRAAADEAGEVLRRHGLPA